MGSRQDYHERFNFKLSHLKWVAKKLKPIVPIYQSALTDFRGRYWAYYTQLLKFKREPTLEKKLSLAIDKLSYFQ